MLNAIKKANEAVCAGNIYRKAKYGNSDTFKESYDKARNVKPNKPDSLPFYRTEEVIEMQSAVKMRYQFWDEWTGSRYERVENPFISKDYFSKHNRVYGAVADMLHKAFMDSVMLGAVIRNDPVTGKYIPI